MWTSIIQWTLGVPKMLGDLASFFTMTLQEVADIMPWIPGIATAVKLWAKVFPNATLLGFISATGVVILLLFLMIRKIWPF